MDNTGFFFYNKTVMNMKEKVEDAISVMIDILEKDERITYLKNRKQELLQNGSFLNNIKKLQELDIYSNEYKKLKKELFQNPIFVEFKHLENEINLLILEINQKLNVLTDERGCNHASN